MSPEESITQALLTMKAGFIANDVDQILSVYAEDFEGSDGRDKDAVREFLQGMVDQGLWDDMEVNMEDAEIVVMDDSASASPVSFVSDWGAVNIIYTFRKGADGVWRVFSSEQAY
jgi:ketosteroid isomerase-like protein